jgi:transcriptional regulator
MYVPASFRETDLDVLHAFVEQHSFAILVSDAGGEPFGTHLPFLLDRQRGPHGTLVGHMARANPHWQTAAGKRALAIFHGPHAYISPAWYESENVVPTWNYVAVHAYGTLQAIDDRERLLEVLRQTVDRYESSRPVPWRLESQKDEFLARMLDAIVGFEIPIDRFEGKWKLNQNHPAERRGQVIRALESSSSPDAAAIARLMEETL